jgi:hypothetical protein
MSPDQGVGMVIGLGEALPVIGDRSNVSTSLFSWNWI